MKLIFRAAQTVGAGMSLAVSGINIEVGGVDALEVDGVPYGAATPGATKLLEGIYGPGEDLVKAVGLLKPRWQVWANSNDGPGIPGSGPMLPPIRYGTTPNKLWIACMNPDHPYFDAAPHINATTITAQLDAAPAAQKALADVKAGTVPQSGMWETTPATLDPGSMRILLLMLGGTTEDYVEYRRIYYKRWGRQAPDFDGKPSPVNREVITDAELAAIIAS